MVHGLFHLKNLSLRSIFSPYQLRSSKASCYFLLEITYFRELSPMRLAMCVSLDQLMGPTSYIQSIFSLYVYGFIVDLGPFLKEERELKVHPTFPSFFKEKGM